MKEVNLHIEREFVQDRMNLVNTWHDMLVLGLPQEQKDTVLGGWMTEAKLALQDGWDELGPKINVDHQITTKPFDWFIFEHVGLLRTMVKCAVKWATARGLTRTNPVHGKDEFRVPLDEIFEHSDTNRSLQRASSSVALEA